MNIFDNLNKIRNEWMKFSTNALKKQNTMQTLMNWIQPKKPMRYIIIDVVWWRSKIYLFIFYVIDH